MLNVYLATLGCRLNEAELAMWSREFEAGGHDVVRAPGLANVMLLNTCAVTSQAARKSRQLIRRMHRENPTAKMVITGCYAELSPERVAELAGVDLVVSNQDKDRLVDLVAENIEPTAMPAIAQDPDPESTYLYRKARNRAFIKVQDGCRNKCSFCIVTVARGSERSRTIDSVVQEIQGLAEEGYREVVLSGVHIGGYGKDLGTSLRSLLEAILARTTIERLRVGSLEPWDLPDGFFELFEDRRLCPHLHLPLQSGCDTVLARMSRRCTTAQYARLVEDARAAVGDLNLTTDLIVGFPGETDAEWDKTVDYVRSIGFGHMHIFTYSAREGTRAARLPGQLPKQVKRERSQQLHELAAQMKAERLEANLGQLREVLWEGPGVPLEGGGSLCAGYSEDYIRTKVAFSDDRDRENEVDRVRVVGLDEDGESVLAELA